MGSAAGWEPWFLAGWLKTTPLSGLWLVQRKSGWPRLTCYHLSTRIRLTCSVHLSYFLVFLHLGFAHSYTPNTFNLIG